MIGENKSIGIEELIDEVRAQFENIAEIYVWHRLSGIDIVVHTDEADSFEKYLDMPHDMVEIDIDEADPLCVEFNVRATYDGPGGHFQGAEGTTIYMWENVRGAKSRDLDEGLTRLWEKLAGKCPTCGNEVDDLSSHYRENEDCAEDDRTQRNKFDTLGRPITDESKRQRSLSGNDNRASEKLSNEEIAKIVDTVRHASRQAVKSYKSTLRNDKPFQKMDI